MRLQPGDTGTVVALGDGRCAARFHGLVVGLPIECVERLVDDGRGPRGGSRAGGPG